MVPAELRERLQSAPGDALFVQIEENGYVPRLAKAVNPFDTLAALGERAYRQGQTRNLRDFAAEEGIDLDDEVSVRGSESAPA
jgi:bifunctional DNA-binding transcriptional regulator/antitoxin component of YhaV-PrlF toxin-antitoxin module